MNLNAYNMKELFNAKIWYNNTLMLFFILTQILLFLSQNFLHYFKVE